MNKLRTFADKDQHQLFLEPEGRSTNEYYLNGFSSSLPWEIQLEALHKIRGFEDLHIYRPGYAIEYDYFPPTQLHHSLETKLVSALYFAGQVNGTTGYEEAAAQGLMAGINAHRMLKGEEAVVLQRDEAYIGVLIDDLVTKGVDEPYRMFTSRAEYRILLRQDNADIRLTPIGYKIGLITQKRYDYFVKKNTLVESLISFTRQQSIHPNLSNGEYKVHDQSSIQKATQAMTKGIDNFVRIITIISMVVGGVGIMNIMYVSVMERGKEIGIRRALGAKPRTILFQFLVESVFITSVGGVMGVIVGYAITMYSRNYLPIKPIPSFNSFLYSFIAIVLTGIIFGLVPAYKASKLDPIKIIYK